MKRGLKDLSSEEEDGDTVKLVTFLAPMKRGLKVAVTHRHHCPEVTFLTPMKRGLKGTALRRELAHTPAHRVTFLTPMKRGLKGRHCHADTTAIPVLLHSLPR